MGEGEINEVITHLNIIEVKRLKLLIICPSHCVQVWVYFFHECLGRIYHESSIKKNKNDIIHTATSLQQNKFNDLNLK